MEIKLKDVPFCNQTRVHKSQKFVKEGPGLLAKGKNKPLKLILTTQAPIYYYYKLWSYVGCV